MTLLPWVNRFPVGLFAVPVGFLALAGTWRRTQGFGWTLALPVANALASIGVLMLAVLLLLFALKCLRHPRIIAAEFTHPLMGSMMGLIPLSLLLCTIFFGEPNHSGWLLFTLLTLTLQGVIAVRVVASLSNGSFPASAVSPALYVPPLAGGLVGSMALSTLGYPGWAALLFGMGLVSWALLEVRVLNRLFEGALPEALRPTIGLELAPASIATLAVATLWPQLPGDVLIIGLGIAAGPVVTVLARYKWWGHLPFSIGFWSFSFPLASLATVIIEIVRRGDWPAVVGGLALGGASALIAFLSIRTLGLMLKNKLLPPPLPSN